MSAGVELKVDLHWIDYAHSQKMLSEEYMSYIISVFKDVIDFYKIKIYLENPITNINIMIYQVVIEGNIISYFKDLAERSKLLTPKIITGKQALNGSPARVWTVIYREAQ